jgi:hypothetical protein
MTRMVLGLALMALVACSEKAESPAAAPSAAAAGSVTAADFHTELPMKELMGHVIDHAADGIWLAQGWLINAEGTHELFPTTDDGWKYASNSAVTLAEASNLLLLPGRPVDDDRRWVDAAHALHDAAMQAHEMAEKRDKEAFFTAGSSIYEACVQCHSHYIIGN